MENTKYKKDFKKGFKLGLLFLFVLFSVRSCNKMLDEKWSERGSIYDIRSEVHWGMLTTPPYGFALWLGIPDDSWVLKPLVALNNNLYESGISKIPETDSERARLWYYYKYWSYTWSNPQKYAAIVVPEAMKGFELLSKSKSKSQHFREVEQYYIITRLAHDFFLYKGFVDYIPITEKNKTLVSMTKWLIENCDSLNIGLFLRNKNISGDFQTPLACQRWKIKYMEHAYQNGMLCEKISLKAIDENYKKMQELAQTYYVPRYKGKNQPGILQNIDYMLKHYDENRNKILTSPERCKE